MACQKCGSQRVLSFGGKCNDCFACNINDIELDGYIPRDLGIGGGDYLEGSVCLDCGQMQGQWPRPQTEMETPDEDQ